MGCTTAPPLRRPWRLLLLSPLLGGLLRIAGASDVEPSKEGRHVHWVLRTSDLKVSLDFFRNVFGMKVLRHEEHEAACPITCNGQYNTAWSKTMVGYGTEDKGYAIELTYSYGVKSYKKGEALRSIAIRMRKEKPLLKLLEAAGELGFGPAESDGQSIKLTGPDGYVYLLLPPSEDEEDEQFDHIRLRVSNLETSVDFYSKILGMGEPFVSIAEQTIRGRGELDDTRVVGYAPPTGKMGGVPLILEEASNNQVKVEPWDGRHAVTMPELELYEVYEQLKEEMPESILHPLKEVKDKLGKLLITVVRDPDGLEICLMSAEVFNDAVLALTDYAEPDWKAHKAKIMAAPEIVAPAANAGERPANQPEHSFLREIEENPAFAEVKERLERFVRENQSLAEAVLEPFRNAVPYDWEGWDNYTENATLTEEQRAQLREELFKARSAAMGVPVQAAGGAGIPFEGSLPPEALEAMAREAASSGGNAPPGDPMEGHDEL